MINVGVNVARKIAIPFLASFTAIACTADAPVQNVADTQRDSVIMQTSPHEVENMTVESPAFENGKALPARFTCVGDGVAPPLQMSHVPTGAKSLVVMLEDPDAPGSTYVHWLMWNWPAQTASIPAGIKPLAQQDNGAIQGTGSSGKVGYTPPCPPSGTHRYYFRVYALDIMLQLPSSSTQQALLAAMRGHVLAQGEIMATYHKP